MGKLLLMLSNGSGSGFTFKSSFSKLFTPQKVFENAFYLKAPQSYSNIHFTVHQIGLLSILVPNGMSLFIRKHTWLF